MKDGVTIIAINMKNQVVLSKMMEPSYVLMEDIFIKQLKNNASTPPSSGHGSQLASHPFRTLDALVYFEYVHKKHGD